MSISSQAKTYAIASIVLAGVSALACVLLIAGALGFGAAMVFEAPGTGALVAGLGLFGGIVGLLVSGVQVIGAVGILNGRKMGLWIGLGFAALSVLGGLTGAWFSLIFGVFGIWALWSSRSQFH